MLENTTTTTTNDTTATTTNDTTATTTTPTTPTPETSSTHTPSSSDEHDTFKVDFKKTMDEAMASFNSLKQEVDSLKSSIKTSAIMEPHGDPTPTCEEALHALYGGEKNVNNENRK